MLLGCCLCLYLQLDRQKLCSFLKLVEMLVACSPVRLLLLAMIRRRFVLS